MRRVSATARCQYCSWSAKYTGDDVIEVATFLRRLCIEHTEAMHADEHNHRVDDSERKRREGA